MTMRITTLLHQAPTTALLALAVAFAGWQCPARAQGLAPDTASKRQQTPTGRIVWQHVGRVFVNPTTGQFVYVGYLVHIDPIDGSLFNGSPSESTAYFTFSNDVAQLTPLANNNDVALDLVSAGTFSVYYNATPGADWSNPASFSSGKLIATFHRNESLFLQVGPVSFHSLSETLMSTSRFEFGPDLQLQSHFPERNYFRAVFQHSAASRNHGLCCLVSRRGHCVCSRYSGGAAVVAVNRTAPQSGDGFSMSTLSPSHSPTEKSKPTKLHEQTIFMRVSGASPIVRHVRLMKI
jgi:hypothetical protein